MRNVTLDDTRLSAAQDDSVIERDVALPGSRVPYRLAAGTGRGYLLGGQVNRFMATCAETGGALAVANPVGPAGVTVPPHFHNEQHDVLFCLGGRMQVWAGEESRILTAGDVVSIPPHTVHTFELLGHYTEVLSPVVPCRWQRFFEIMGVPYDGSAYPVSDPSGPPTPEQIAQVDAEDLMVRVPDYGRARVTFDAADDRIPEERSLYFLRASEGPRHALFGQVCFQVVPGRQTDGGSAMTITEGPASPPVPRHVHHQAHEVIFCMSGRMRVWAAGAAHRLGPGDVMSLPSGVEHTYALDGAFNRFATMLAPAGLEQLFELAGAVAETPIYPSSAPPADRARLAEAAQVLDITFTD